MSTLFGGCGDGVELLRSSGVESGEPGTEKRSCLGVEVVLVLVHTVDERMVLKVDPERAESGSAVWSMSNFR